MNRPSRLPGLIRLLIAWPVPPAHREAVLGDFEEEYRTRRLQDPVGARAWLVREVVLSALPWIRWRAARAPLARLGLAPLLGLAVVLVGLDLLNTAPVLEAVRSLPEDHRVTVAWGLNLLATAAGGYAAGRVALQAALPLACLLSAGLLLLVLAGNPGPGLPSAATALAVPAAALVGAVLGLRARPA